MESDEKVQNTITHRPQYGNKRLVAVHACNLGCVSGIEIFDRKKMTKWQRCGNIIMTTGVFF